jgi:hypothetical protein
VFMLAHFLFAPLLYIPHSFTSSLMNKISMKQVVLSRRQRAKKCFLLPTVCHLL